MKNINEKGKNKIKNNLFFKNLQKNVTYGIIKQY